MSSTSNGPNPHKASKSTDTELYKKYAKASSSNWLDPTSKLKPSDLCKSSVDVVADDYPKIIEFNNIKDNSCQVHSTVDIDQPLFQPSPKVVVFEDYAPFAIHEKKLFFRNNDSVARRIKVHRPKTPFFEISAPKTTNGEPLKQTKIAPGMEIYYVIQFKPQQVHEYALELVCSTEREKFVVPIRAVGMQPRMTFPDDITFGTCAVKSTTRKTLLVQNVGSSVARFFMRTSVNAQSFTCPTEELTVEAGASQMIELFFTPQSAKLTEGEIEVEFVNNKLRCYISVSGIGRNVDVSLSTPSVALEPSYISLSSQKTMRIKNTSDVPINFVWKSFSSQEEEETERGRLLNEINRMEAIEQSAFQDRLRSGFYDQPAKDAYSSNNNYNDEYGSNNYFEDYENEDGNDGGDGGLGLPPAARADAATLMRKYRNLRTALENDPMQFVDDIFEISPVQGNVWARSEIEITITFRPDTAAKYTCLGYLDISGRQDRLSLHLSGQGIGPHAALSFDVLDVGDVFINDEQNYDLSISNKGDIPAQWSFLPSLTRFGNKFDFTPKSGYLAAGHSQSIRIRFESDVLGEFSEVFRFALQGNDDVLACQVKGHVVGPTFHFDCGRIDFGIVSFDYLHSTKLRLVNTSKIPMVFNLHVPQDGTFLKKEFDVDPKEGTLSPGQYVNVSIEFIPSSVKVYDYSLAVDVLGVGESLLSVPISAECKVMSLKIVERDIMYGDVFIRYPYERELLLFNPSDVLHTKFEMLPQQAYTKYFATYEAEPSVGVIEPGDTMRVIMRLVADRLAVFKMPVGISIAGSKEPPLNATLQYTCVGPRVRADVTEIRWGNIDCLRDSSRSMTITNDSLISAHIKIFLKMARSKFELSASEMVLEPQQSYELVITANLDDSVVIKDEVHIVVDEGDDIMIPLSAKGVGTTMFCGHDLTTLDLGVQLTNCVFERKIVLENKGRRVQQLRWINVTARDENLARASKAKGMGRDANISRLPKHLAPIDPIFTVTPEEITLRPRTATTFTFKGFSGTPNACLREVFILESKVGKERTFKQIALTEIKAQIVNPLLEFSEPRLDFVYTWVKDVPAHIQRRELVLKNTSAIALTFVLGVENPFNLSSFEHSLQPGESCDITVEFDPLYKDDKQSHTVEKVLLVSYRGHPQKDTLPLTAEINFPNIAFDLSTVAFGCVLNDSSKVIKLLATNVSKVVCTYEWMFQDEMNNSKSTGRRGGKDKRASTKRGDGGGGGGNNNNLTCEQVFDVMPVRSVLNPGESEEVQFSMFGVGNSKIVGSAFCIVEGGPEYTLPLSGEASVVSFALDKSIVDFGSVVFTDRKDEEIGIVNNGRVQFTFEVFPLTTSLGEILEAIPSTGKVNPGERAKIILRMRLAMPATIADTLMFKVAHFDPVAVNVYCTGIFPSAVVSLPRHARIGPYGETSGAMAELWDAFTTRANDNITQLQQSLAAPALGTLPQPLSATSAMPPQFIPPPPAALATNLDDSNAMLELENDLRQFLVENTPAKSMTSATKGGPVQLALEVEMQRMALCYHLTNKIEETRIKLLEEFNAKQLQAQQEAESLANNPLAQGSVSTARSGASRGGKHKTGGHAGGKDKDKEAEKEDHGLQALVAKFIDLKDIVTANYLCDFGNVIIGQQRKKVFQVCNASQAGHISWTFEKKFLSGSPFSIEPDRVSKLLEMGNIDFTVKCNARNDSKLGRKTYVLPIEIKGTGTANIMLSGNFCVPELELSVEEIDFGKVLLGRSKQMFVRLFNTSPVTAAWKIKVTGTERDSRVTVTPSEGSLRAGKHTVLCVEFIPQETRSFTIEKVFKIESNKKTKSLRISGEGVGLGVKFDPPLCDMNPVIPFSPGDSKVITMINTSDMPIEVYSIDYDNIYREEEALLSSVASIFDDMGLFRCDARNAGESLPREVMIAKAMQDRAVESAADGEAGDGSAAGSASAADSLLPAPIRTHPAPRDDGKQQDIVLLGPPVSGMTVLADNLSKRLILPVKFLDSLIEDVAGTTGDVGLIARRVTNRLTSLEGAEVAEREQALLAAAEQSKIAAEEAYKKSKNFKKGKDTPEEVFQTPEVAEYQKFLDSGKLTVATLAEVIKARVSWDDVGYGFILDNVYSSYAAPKLVLQALKEALPGLIVGNVVVNDGENGYLNKLSTLYYNKCNRVNEMTASVESCRKNIAKLRVQLDAQRVKEAKQSKMSAAKGGDAPATQQPPRPSSAVDPSAPTTVEADMMVPVGDEPWLKPDTGAVLELEPLDYKALDVKQKFIYNRQWLYQLVGQLLEDEVVLAKIRRIWSIENGLKTEVDPPAVSSEVKAQAEAVEEAASLAGADVNVTSGEQETVITGDEVLADATAAAGPAGTVRVETYVTKQQDIVVRLPARVVLYRDYVDLRAAVDEVFNVTSSNAASAAVPEPEPPVPAAGKEKPGSKPNSRPASGANAAGAGAVNVKKPSSPPSPVGTGGLPLSAELVTEAGVDSAAGPADGGVKDSGLFLISVEAEDAEDTVQTLAMALLPPPKVPPPDKNAVPAPKLMQVIRRPHGRVERKLPKQYSIVPITDEEIAALASASADGAVLGEVPAPSLPSRGTFRWIIPPFGSTKFKVAFQSQTVGKYEMNMRFEVLGSQQQYSLHCGGVCELPNINRDTRNLFMRRQKQLQVGQPLPQRKFITSDDTYCFGPLLMFKKPEWRFINPDGASEADMINYNLVQQTNVDVIRLSNNGKYKCTVECGFQNVSDDVRSVFLVEPHTVELEEGETKEVKIWAFPTAVREYNNTLVICVSNNPVPLAFGVKCWGVEPTIELNGPWKDAIVAAEAAVAACTDKKLIKDLEAKVKQLKDDMTLDFERQLINKTETRSYQVTNTSLLPVAFVMDAGDFTGSANMSISPMEGIIPANTTIPITLSFTSPEPLMVTGKFSMRYSDAEGGLNGKERVGTKGFRAVAEAYKITAVSLTFEGKEDGGSDIDFGLLRVGDYASQIMKVANKGKYRIGYKFIIPKGTMSNLVKIEPEEGIIETGNANSVAEVKVTFCCTSGELNMKSNKEIRVQISEPLTGELVESFPLYVSAVVKYNAFRMQPAKGLAFGAVRFDSESKSKRVELRNEGNFEFVYVICPARAEIEELDALDVPAFGCYAFNVPAALRKAELGDNYRDRLGGRGASADAKGGKGAKDKAAPPAKGAKGGAAAAAGAEGSKGSNNPLVFDPDSLSPGVVPTDPLTIGSFRIFPRIGVVQPGQSVGIDATFDPSGCGTVHERLRICITGVNPKEPNSIVLKSFELTGESCVPAIVVDDVVGIFEEQEVVSSLADAVGDSNGSGSKVDKIGVGKVVYAETDKVLAFGPVLCGAAGSRGVVERVKITNPTKIDTRVQFSVTDGPISVDQPAADAKAADPKSKKDAKGAGGAKGGAAVPEAPAQSVTFTAQPSVWEIPPHESRFVNIYFNPTEIKSYRACFNAVVDTAGSTTTAPVKLPNGSGKQLTFDLVGSGTIPCIAVEQPTVRLADGSLSMEFGKVHINKSSRRKIVLANDGVMPVTCLFDMVGDEDFHFSYRGASLTLQPKEKGECTVLFMPKKVFAENNSERNATIKISVLNNQFDNYTFKLKGSSYACEALLDTVAEPKAGEELNDESASKALEDAITLPEVNLAEASGHTSSYTVKLRSRSQHPLKFGFSATSEDVAKVISFSPQVGHIGPGLVKEISVIFSPTAAVSLTASPLKCTLTQIAYSPEGGEVSEDEVALRGQWDDSMKSVRVATQDDLKLIAAVEANLKAYNDEVEAEKKKGKKGKPVPVPDNITCNLQLGPVNEDGSQVVYEIVNEPKHTVNAAAPVQELQLTCSAVADYARYSCVGHGENIPFKPTYMYQAAVHRFTFTNDSNISMPLQWGFDDIKRTHTTQATRASTTRNQSRGANAAGGHSAPPIPCPFMIEPDNAVIGPKQSKEFTLRFQPLEVDDFVYLLKGETVATLAVPPTAEPAAAAAAAPPAKGKAAAEPPPVEAPKSSDGPVRMVVRGTAKRPICHIDMKESLEYLTRRPPNMPNEYGMKSPIETGDIRVVELESTGLKTRNTYRFHVSNPTSDNYEFCWEAVGESSPAWRCVQSAGMLFSGKRVEMVFEYLPEETAPAEAFFKFKLPSVGLEQLFLFAGKVIEPKVTLSTSKIDFHSVMLGGEGATETVYLENNTHLPFNYAFEKGTLLQLEGPRGTVLDINPKSGVVLPHSKTPIVLSFKPQEEVSYNFNIQLDVKRKPNKLSINVKGEGYAVHPLIQLEQGEGIGVGGDRYLTLRPAPAVNYADFGAVQVLDSISKKLTVLNSGKYNFDYIWDVDNAGNMLVLSGGKMGGTLHKGQEMSYNLTFAPTREVSIDGTVLTFTVAGKYVYTILGRGSGVTPALRFSFMHYDFGACFVTSPGGSTVVEEVMLRLVNHDPNSNIAVECVFTKTRALWVECPPTVLEAGSVLDVPIRFAPRDVKDYEFIVPFVVNGTSRVNVHVIGKGINARVELLSAANRRTNFGIVNVGSEMRKPIQLVNRSKRAVSVQLLEDSVNGAGALETRCVSFFPKSEFTIGPKEATTIQLVFNPTKRISNFSEDLLIRFAGLTRKLLTVAGRAQGMEVTLDTDSLPFGTVVMDSQKVRKVTLENAGDLPITYQWMESTFGPHFSISPLSGKVNPANEVSFQVVFRPKFVDEDIRQEGILLSVPGVAPMLLTCSGSCINQPSESISTLQFKSLARKAEVKAVKISNPSDKDWYISPSLQGVHWNIPHEFKVPAKGAADLNVTYYPLSMAMEPTAAGGAPSSNSRTQTPTGDSNMETVHEGQLFLALPDGTAQLYKLRGNAGPPECSGIINVSSSAKKATTTTVKLLNWLGETQKFKVSHEFTDKASPASFVVAANAVEVGPNGTKEFPVRFISYGVGESKGTLRFTNPVTNEYLFYQFNFMTTKAEILDTLNMESPVRQTARTVITLENPLPAHVNVSMINAPGATTWWSCEGSKYIRVNELSTLSGNTEGSYEIEYRPLVISAQPTEATIHICTKELGTYSYKVVLKSTPPTLRQLLRFEVSLGSIQSEMFVFKAYNSVKCDFTLSLSRSDVFAVAKQLPVEAVRNGWDGDDIKVPISFEPTAIGEVRDTLTLTSPHEEGGTYVCELIANCTAPLPQGPFQVAAGAKLDIPFRNCFSTATNWSFSVDSSAFVVSTANNTSVAPKSQGIVSVQFTPKDEHRNVAGGIVTAKLFVNCSSKPELPSWVFYLRGKVDEEYFTQAAGGGKKK